MTCLPLSTSRRQTLIAALVAVTTAAAALPAVAQPSYPSRPIRIVSPYAPGGPTDVLARVLAARLSPALGQSVIVENKAGGGGTVGTMDVVRSAPDGHTLLLGALGPLAINASLMKKLPYDPLRDLAPVAQVAEAPLILVVHPSVAARSVGELLALLKAKPNSLSYGTGGNGTPQHLSMELLKTVTGTQLTHVPYRGTGPAISDLLAGTVQVAFESPIALAQHIKAGKLRALAVTSAARTALLPEVPTLAEAGVKGYEAVPWYALVAPAGTPKDVVARLNAEVLTAMASPEVAERLAALGATAAIGTPEQLGALMRSEQVKWGKVVRDSGASIDE
jgi:tripartite-type tricarboxylate transporter receptor subunit TctC